MIYINLKVRKDRKAHIEEELKKAALLKCKIFPLIATHDELNGTRGCVHSHLRALDVALNRGWKTTLILEDDCTFLQRGVSIDGYVSRFLTHFQEDWDIFFLGGLLKESEATAHPDYLRVRQSLRAHAYAVNQPYLAVLRAHLMQIYGSMEEDLFFLSSWDKALDRQWASLQRKDRWYIGKKPIAYQRASFSDIEKGFKPER